MEYINCGKAVYSRIARVCKKDTGGRSILNQNWATYLKARLNCSISGEFPFYFNEIQAVYQLPNDKTKFYATFATSTNGLVGSAVCSFDINEVQSAFAGRQFLSFLLFVYKNVYPYFSTNECGMDRELTMFISMMRRLREIYTHKKRLHIFCTYTW